MRQKVSPGHKARLKALIEAEADTMDCICTHVAQGGSLIDLCRAWDVFYGSVINWLNKDPGRKELYHQADLDRTEWAKELILQQLREIAGADIRTLFDENGNLKPPSQWDEEIAKAVCGYDVTSTEFGDNKKLKMNDKLKAIELLGKQMAMFRDRVTVDGELTLADLVAMSNKPKPEGT